ncbi:hypothetical protein RI129_000311, partial [Pyrocoelia pectoralis]
AYGACIYIKSISNNQLNGYSLTVNRFENCIPNSLVKIDKFNMTLDANCNIVPSGCMIITKGFTTSTVHYILSKRPLPTIEGNENVCSYLRDSKDMRISSVFQLPRQCPVLAGKMCGNPNKKISISQFRNKLSIFAGNLSLKMDFTHDNEASCIDLHFTLKKN